MRIIKKVSLITTALLLSTSIKAQQADTLTLLQSIDQALTGNYGIKIAKSELAVTQNNAQPGNAGLLPSIDATAGVQYTNNNTKSIFAGDIPPIDQSGVTSRTYNASVGLTYTLFDGLGNVNTLKRLKVLENLGEEQTRLTIEGTLVQVASAYYEVARQQANINVLRQTLEISEDRYQRIKGRYDLGGTTRVEWLNAEVDLNSDSINLVNAEIDLENAKRDLNFLIGADDATDYAVENRVNYEPGYVLEELREKAAANNAAITSAAYAKMASEKDLKVAQSFLYPRLDGSASYGYNQSFNDANILLENRQVGFTGGLTLSLNLFNGKQKYIQMQNAQLAIETDQLRYEEALKSVDTDVLNTYASFRNAVRVKDFEITSLETAQLNFERTQEAYRLGQSTGLEFRQAQFNLLSAQIRLINAYYTIKITEIELLRLSGELMVRTN